MRLRFVIHEHHATRLHWDLRLEMGGVYKSWAVPKGPSMNPADKRLAVAVPDHSLAYGSFEGQLAEGTYGAGEVRIWDDGKYEAVVDPELQLNKGKITFTFFGLKVRGEFTLVKTREANNWLLIKVQDHFAEDDWRSRPSSTRKSTAGRERNQAFWLSREEKARQAGKALLLGA